MKTLKIVFLFVLLSIQVSAKPPQICNDDTLNTYTSKFIFIPNDFSGVILSLSFDSLGCGYIKNSAQIIIKSFSNDTVRVIDHCFFDRLSHDKTLHFDINDTVRVKTEQFKWLTIEHLPFKSKLDKSKYPTILGTIITWRL